VNGARWQRFDASRIDSGGAFLVVRSVHDGNLYMAPKKAEIPDAKELSGEGLLKFATVKAAKPPAPPVKGKGKEVAEGEKPKKKAEVSKPKPDPKVEEVPDEDQGGSSGTLTGFKCPECQAMHGFAHASSCSKRTSSWGKMTPEAKKQREEHLSGPAKDQKPKDKGDKLSESDPLKLKPKPLEAKEEAKLRKHFGLSEQPKPAELEPLNAKERKELLSKSQLPKWAVAAVLADRENLKSILDGSLTLEKFQAGKYSRGAKKLTQPQIAAKWNDLKKRYEGFQLLEKPRSEKEKKFRKDFDLLKKEVGDHPSLPTPKDKRTGGGNGRSSPQQSERSNSAVPSEFLNTLKAIAEIVKAFK